MLDLAVVVAVDLLSPMIAKLGLRIGSRLGHRESGFGVVALRKLAVQTFD